MGYHQIIVVLARRQIRFVLSLTTAIWMAVMSGGVNITHCHAGGGERHTHNCGNRIALSSTFGSPRTPLEPHRHLLLFGIEFPSESAPDSGPLEPGTCLTAQAIRCDCNSVQPNDFDPQSFAVLTPLDSNPILDPSRSTASPSLRSTLPAVASRDRSGVLRL